MSRPNTPVIAYFCTEYGFDQRLPIYAGGLGILAGDTLKAAADASLPFVGIGLLYRGHSMKQSVDQDGWQHEQDWDFDPLRSGLEHVYLDDQPVFVKVHLTTVDVWLRVWKKEFGNNVTLYLLDSETDQNQICERGITQVLYPDAMEIQLKQQLLLGIGGVKLLTLLGYQVSAYHVNEGRPVFIYWQIIRELMDIHGISYETAKELAKSKTVYTNHTLVSSAYQGYPTDMISVYGKYYAEKMGISVNQLFSEGTTYEHPDTFAPTFAALRTSRVANGVSKLHSHLSSQQWPEYNWTSVTNGVHLPTWQDYKIRANAHDLHALWHRHLELKQQTMDFVQHWTGYGYDHSALVLGWARRIAGYKQLDALFEDIDRLKQLLSNQDRPVFLLISGKTHPKDTAAKSTLQTIIKHLQTTLSGRALYIPNYSLAVAQALTRGVDVWLNTPIKGQEASGTSGMKALSNGVLQCTVPDGWAAEVEWAPIGWSLDNHQVGDKQSMAHDLYSTLENKVVPEFYTKNDQNISASWLQKMQASIALADQFSAARMIAEYQNQLYTPQR